MNTTYLHILAATPTDESGGLLDMLGIDVWTLAFQIIAFLILVFVLGKWVYPIFVGIIDKRQDDIEAAAQAANEAKEKADEANSEVADLLREARAEAGQIVATAKDEAAATVEAAEKKAKTRADAIVASAQADIEKQILAAKKELRNETVDLVALATEKVLGSAVTAKVDEKVITEALKEVDA